MAVALESESNNPSSGQIACGQALCNLLQTVSVPNGQEPWGDRDRIMMRRNLLGTGVVSKAGRNGWSQAARTCCSFPPKEGKVLEEGTASSKISQDFLDISGGGPPSPAERWARAGCHPWLLLGLQASWFACKHKALAGV